MGEYLADIKRCYNNDKCADCGQSDPGWVSCSLAIFICERCAGIHKSLSSNVSLVKSIEDDNWKDELLQVVAGGGNCKASEIYEQHVPLSYRRPQPSDPHLLLEQWIRAKYERKEFFDRNKQNYITGYKDGKLWKRGKTSNKFALRRFVLSAASNSLVYFNKTDAKVPKGCMQVDRININMSIAAGKLSRPYSMQIMYRMDNNSVRNIYVSADTGEDLVSWYSAIRHVKFTYLTRAHPLSPVNELTQHLSNDLIREGWLYKTGPQPGSKYRKRWMSLDTRQLFYFSQPLDAYALGEIFIGSRETGYTVREGVPPGVKEFGFVFTLKTPTRLFYLSAETAEERSSWLQLLRAVIASPLSPVVELKMLRR